MRKLLPLLLILFIFAGFSAPDKKPKKEPKEVTQTLPPLKDPPAAVIAETGRLVFHASPLSAKGLLSQQVRDALKALLKTAKDAPIVDLRAFTAGSGDTRRVQTLVSETFTDRHLALPALSVAQVGALPLAGAQVVMEAVSVAKKPVNPYGLAFLSGQPAVTAEQSASNLRKVLEIGGMEPGDVVRVSCFLSSVEEAPTIAQQLHASFPSAALTLVQIQRVPIRDSAECEAVARLRAPIDSPVKVINAGKDYSQMVMVSAPKLVFTGSQLAFGKELADVRLAFQRLEKDLEPLHASLKDSLMAHMYALSNPVADRVGKVRFEFYDRSKPPAGTILQLEGLPAMDATFAIDVIAVAQ